MDWNWFFSSLAQSSAAIVGVFTAFVITKIITNQADFSKNTAKTKDILNQCERFKDEASNRYFFWWSKHTLSDKLDSLESALIEDKVIKAAEQYYKTFDFPEFIERALVLDKIERRIRFYKNPEHKDKIFGGIDGLAKKGIARNLRPQLDHEKELIDKLVVELRYHTRTVLSHYNYIKDDPESSSAISYSIVSAIALFFVGVIYPLSFTPIAAGQAPELALSAFSDILFSLRGILLSAISLIFVGMLTGFMIINSRLHHKQADKDALLYYSVFGNYSRYLEIMEANRIELNLAQTKEDDEAEE
jgi:hypothetical protein